MKYLFGISSVVIFLGFAMLGWNIAGRFMTPKDEMSVAKDIVIIGTILGLLTSGVAWGICRVTKTISATASLEAGQAKKK